MAKLNEIDDIINTLLFPARYARSVVNGGSPYPPYNIIKDDETHTTIEMAVAGFKQEEIAISVEEDQLKISGKKNQEPEIDYIYKGIGTRAFEKVFNLAPGTVVDTVATYKDGILSVKVQTEPVEQKKPKIINIKTI